MSDGTMVHLKSTNLSYPDSLDYREKGYITKVNAKY